MIILNGSPERKARAVYGARWPWLMAVIDVRCAWCDRDLSACYCLDRPGPPARPLPDARAFVASLRVPDGDATNARDARYRRTYRAKLRARGVCARCQRPSKQYLCTDCRAANAQYGAAWRERCVETGRCQRCGDPAVPGRINCATCGHDAAERARAWRAARRSVRASAGA